MIIRIRIKIILLANSSRVDFFLMIRELSLRASIRSFKCYSVR